MDDSTFTRPGIIRLDVSPARLVLIPGGRGSVRVTLTHRGGESGDYDVSLAGLPDGWAAGPAPLIGMSPVERREVQLQVRVPPFPGGRPGRFAAEVRAVRRGEGAAVTTAVCPVTVIVAVFALEGRVGVLMEATRFLAEPGESLEIPLTLSNHGLAQDTFAATIEGLPRSWITSPLPLVLLGPGEAVVVSFAVSAPRGTAAGSGVRPFTVRVSSQGSPDQETAIECALDVPEMHLFGAQLTPADAPAGQSSAVKVQNRGNAPARYSLIWHSPDHALSFTPPGPAEMTVEAGETRRLAFMPRLRRRPLIGGPARYAYTVQVASEGQVQVVGGRVLAKALLPGWLGTAALFTAILAALMFLLVQWAVSQPPATTPTPAATIAPTPTVPPGLTPVG
jgi:uncharacterized membrane protein